MIKINKKLYMTACFITALAFLLIGHPYIGLSWLFIALLFFFDDVVSNTKKVNK